MEQILIVEDDKNLNNGIKIALGKEYYCHQAFSIIEAEKILNEYKISLAILDVNLPDGNGISFVAEIRKRSKVPVIILTADKSETDIVMGLESGANDYITKPFSLMELRARVRVQLRDKTSQEEVFQIDGYYFDFVRMEFINNGNPVELSRTEQKLLRCLLENRGKSVSRSQLIDYIWQGDTEFVEEHALTVVVNRLRNKLRNTQKHPEYIKTVYGIGYTWQI
ncbi:MAG TPA: DNA-binding response regulator [Lachnospiraceae bacterium]|nr:DNA-binding response regulator [Lachnospiraceae bacterium]